MAQAATQEPTMEDILSSIRKIIADDDKPAPPVPDEASATSEAAQVSSDAVKSVPTATPATNAPAGTRAGSLADIAAALKANGTPVPEVAAKPAAAPTAKSEPETEAKVDARPEPVSQTEANPTTPEPKSVSNTDEEQAFKGALMSPSAESAASEAFDRLKRAAMDDVDAKTEAILRPMLREWLDNNLPGLVERLVREEIERVARGDK